MLFEGGARFSRASALIIIIDLAVVLAARAFWHNFNPRGQGGEFWMGNTIFGLLR